MRSLLLLKPDIVAHPYLLKTVVTRILKSDLAILGIRTLRLQKDQAEKLYGMHKGRMYYNRLVRHVTSGPMIALHVSGNARAILGPSRLYPMPARAEDKTLRQGFAISDVRNVAHNSDAEYAEAELALCSPFVAPSVLLEHDDDFMLITDLHAR